MNSGVEGCESELKLAQRWAYDVNYPYDDPGALKQVVLSTNGSNVAAFMVESIQGEGGVRVAKDGGYWKKMKFKLGEDVLVKGCVLTIRMLVQTSLFLPDQQSSTFGVVEEENLASDAFKMEYHFHQQTHGLPSAIVKAVRSKGLLNATEINSGYDARELCIRRNSRMAQRNRVGPITQRSVDRNHALLSFFLAILRVELI
ncbi:Ornithine aminotransferase, mitochondrial [Trichinella murrelli]|uniref:Ornithine aminotransferase n=1 Tax=Trichinella murrelli TaxID=144512 RepID=A0A0V0T676_9BILA|nr:Ornithine aminotransferase, mitochondrial [Trichinella murrelli]